MESKNYFASLVVSNEYFIDLNKNLDSILLKKLVSEETEAEFSNKEFKDFLRFIEILSLSDDAQPQYKNKAVECIAKLLNLLPSLKMDKLYGIRINKILYNLGIYPQIVAGFEPQLNTREQFESLVLNIKDDILRVPTYDDKFFNYAQFKAYQAIKDEDVVAISAPTSMGKSFLVRAYIRNLITESSSFQNIFIIVPTKALINEYVKKFKELFADYLPINILSYINPESDTVKSNNHNLFILTPERLIHFVSNLNQDIELNNITLFIDEAQKLQSNNERDSERSLKLYYSISLIEKKFSINKTIYTLPSSLQEFNATY